MRRHSSEATATSASAIASGRQIDVVPQDALEQGRRYEHPDEKPVAPNPRRGVRRSGLGQQGADEGGQHGPSVGIRARPRLGQKFETSPGRNAGAGPGDPADAAAVGSRDDEVASADPPTQIRISWGAAMSKHLYRWGHWAARRPWAVIGAWVVVSVVVVSAAAAFGRQLEDSYQVPGLDSQQAVALQAAGGAVSAGLTAQVVLTPLDPSATFLDSPDARAALADVQSAVERLPHVLGTNDPVGALAAGGGAATRSGAISADGRVAVLRVQYPVIEELSPADLTALKQLMETVRVGSPLQVEMGGDLFFAFEEASTSAGELIGLIAAVVILLLAFGSLVAMGLPIGMALFGLAFGVSAISLLNTLIDIPSFAPVVGSMVGLGVGIDYALFVVTRHRELLARGLSVPESVGRAVATAGQSVIFAGGTVVIAILGLAVAGIPFLTAAGVAISVIVLVMVVTSVTLLPAFLGLAGHRINGLGGAAAGEGPPRRWGALGEVGASTSRGTPGAMPSASRRCCWPSPHRCSRCGWASRTRGRCRTAVPSDARTTSWRRASAPAPTGRWSSPSTSPRTQAWLAHCATRCAPTRGSRRSHRCR